jgi:hypothetical protein
MESQSSEILGSHGGEYEDDSLLGYCALMTETVRTPEKSANFYETTRSNIPEGCRLRITVRLHAVHNRVMQYKSTPTNLITLQIYEQHCSVIKLSFHVFREIFAIPKKCFK